MLTLIAGSLLMLPIMAAADSVDAHAFSGRVTGTDGAPIAGATVDWSWIEADVPQAMATSITDEDGMYQLTVPKSHAVCRLAVSKEGYAPSIVLYSDIWSHAFLWSTAPPESIREESDGTAISVKTSVHDVVLNPASWMEGVVLDEAGVPITEARVAAYIREPWPKISYKSSSTLMLVPGSATAVTTDEEGRFRLDNLPEKNVYLQIVSPYRWFEGSYVTVDTQMTFVMQGDGKPRAVRAQIVDGETGKPVPAIIANCEHSPTQMHMESPEGVYRLESSDEVWDPSFTFHVFSRGYAPWGGEVLTGSSDNPTERKIELVPAPSVECRIVDAESGAAVSEAIVACTGPLWGSQVTWTRLDSIQSNMGGGTQFAKPSGDGRFWFCEEPDQARTVAISASGYGAVTVSEFERPKPDAHGVVVFALQKEAVLRGVLDMTAFEYEPSSVFLRRVKDLPVEEVFEDVPIAPDGTFELAGLRTGNYTMLIRCAHKWIKLAPAIEVSVRAGDVTDLGVLKADDRRSRRHSRK